MSERDAIRQVNGDIAVLASLIARQRERLDRRRSNGGITAGMELALEDLAELYQQRQRAREVLLAFSRDSILTRAITLLKRRWGASGEHHGWKDTHEGRFE